MVTFLGVSQGLPAPGRPPPLQRALRTSPWGGPGPPDPLKVAISAKWNRGSLDPAGQTGSADPFLGTQAPLPRSIVVIGSGVAPRKIHTECVIYGMKDSVGRFDLGGIGVKDSVDSILAVIW